MSSTVTVGASDVAGILGVSPWSSPWDVWRRLTGLDPRYSAEGSNETRRGHMLEASLGHRYADENGLLIEPGPKIGEVPFIGPEPWMACRPDFWATDGKDLWLLECKTTRRFLEENGWGLGGDQVPAYYLVQCLWQMAVTGLDRVDLIAFATSTDEFRHYTIERRDITEQRLIERVRTWYQRHVVNVEPPPLDGSDACGRTLEDLYGCVHRPATLEADDADVRIARELYEVRQAIRPLEARKGELENHLKALLGNNTSLRLGKKTLASWSKTQSRKSFDVSAFTEAHPALAEQFTREGAQFRTFRLTYKPDQLEESDV